ncbi:MAG TPA: EF-hand domain-containing protein [Methylomirabilota bacterium]|nr:EF-hand domain-containing protein [Methylomirabilota bacterium]
MKRTFLFIALGVGVALGLSVAVGVAWYFMRTQNEGTTAIRATSETEPIEPGAGGADGAAGGNNARATKFVEHDTDQDGKLSLAEFSVGRKPAEAAKWFERRDADHDGFISREEFLPFSAGPKAQ